MIGYPNGYFTSRPLLTPLKPLPLKPFKSAHPLVTVLQNRQTSVWPVQSSHNLIYLHEIAMLKPPREQDLYLDH